MKPATRTRLVALGLGLTASVVLLAVRETGGLEMLERVAIDLQMRLRGAGEADPRVMIVAIDPGSVDRYGQWPWPRTRIAELLERLGEDGAEVVALDVIFSEPSRSTPSCDLSTDDEELARAIAGAGNVVLGYYFRRDLGSGEEGRSNILGEHFEQVIEPPGGYRLSRRQGVETNIDLFADAAASQGFFSNERKEGVLRHYELVVEYDGLFYPALALRAAERALGGELTLQPYAGSLPEIRVGDKRVQADERGMLWVNYRGPGGTFRTVGVEEVLEGRTPPGTFRDKVVFLGATETGIGDLYSSPFGSEMPGVEIHANAADNLLNERYIHDTGLQAAFSTLALLALGPLVALAVVSVRRFRAGSLIAAALITLWPVVCYLAFRGAGWHLEMVAPTSAGVLALVSALRYQIGFVDARSRQIKTTFERFVSTKVVDEMLKDPERVKLGGESREMTVLFCDIQGFTTVSEHADSEGVVQLLNEFFTPMTRIVIAHGGTLDKYMGDALMAFFGAPTTQPDHALRACRAALEMRSGLARLNEAWLASGRLPAGSSGLGIGIGLNSGEMSVGNMGSESIFDYTVIGDHVNLGSRVEGLSRKYGVAIVASEFTVSESERRGGGVLFRELDRVRVKGRETPVAVFQIVSEKPGVPEDVARIKTFGEGLTAYREGEFEIARNLFSGLLERHGEDGPAGLFKERCERFLAEPPAADWDGVTSLTSK